MRFGTSKNHKNAIIVGYGQAGQRLAGILSDWGHDIAVVSERQGVHAKCYEDLSKGLDLEQPELVVLANKTIDHWQSLAILAKKNFPGKILIEKPLFSSIINKDSESFSQLSQRIGVGYNLRFHPLLQKLKFALTEEKIITVSAYCGSYLPDWGSYAKYPQSTSSDKKFGGGVLRDLSHELDYLSWIFGELQVEYCSGGKFSDLPIHSDDAWVMNFSSSKCPLIQLQINYLDRMHRREVTVTTNRNTYRIDFKRNKFEKNDQEECLEFPFIETYRQELTAVLHLDFSILCNYDQALKTVKLMDEIDRRNSLSNRYAKEVVRP